MLWHTPLLRKLPWRHISARIHVISHNGSVFDLVRAYVRSESQTVPRCPEGAEEGGGASTGSIVPAAWHARMRASAVAAKRWMNPSRDTALAVLPADLRCLN